MAGTFRKGQGIKGGKYLVLRRDDTVPPWPWFVLGAADPAAPVALFAYADECERLGMDPEYVFDLREMAGDFKEWHKSHPPGDPDAPRHRTDDPAVVSRMEKALGA